MAQRTPDNALPRDRSPAAASSRFLASAILTLLPAIAVVAPVCAAGTFTELATFRGVGQPLTAIVAPGPQPGSERYYISYSYIGNTAEVVAVDPDTGAYQVFASPDPKVFAAWALATGPDGKIYVGTAGQAKLLRIDPKQGTIVDLGRSSPTETYLFQLAVGSDQKLYGCTYPNAKLIRYDPATGRLEDLGRMDAEQQYARTIAASNDGFIYTGIGFSENHLVAYEIRSSQHRDVLPEQYWKDQISVVRGDDGKVYGQVHRSGTGLIENFRLEGRVAIPLGPGHEIKPAPTNRLKDGRLITNLFDGTLDVVDPRTHLQSRHPYSYAGKEIDIHRVGLGPDGMLYGSTNSPLHFFRVDPATGYLTNIAYLGMKIPGGRSGEIYSLLPYRDSLVLAAYSSLASVMIYDPSKPYNPSAGPGSNPYLVSYPGENTSWRPLAMIGGPGNDIYIGSIAGYGLRGGSLTVLDPAQRRVKSSHEVIAGQSVASLTRWGELLVGGSSTEGGGGSFPTETEARLFLWSPAQKRKIFDIPPVPQASSITDLVTVPDGRVFGVAGPPARADYLFAFDPKRRAVIYRAPLPSPIVVNSSVYNSLTIGPEGRLFGLFPSGIFSAEPKTYEVRVEALYRDGTISAGFALSGRDIYFASGPRLMRYTLP